MSNTQATENNSTKATKMDDPNVRIPAAIRAAAARSDAIHKEAYQPAQEPTQEPVQREERPQPTHPTKKTEDAPQQPVNAQQEGLPEGQQEGQPQNWEHSYKSIKGRYDRAMQAIDAQNQKINDLQAQITEKPAPQQRPASEMSFTPMVTAQERADFGEDFIDVAQRAAREKLEPEIMGLKSELARLTQQLSGVTKVQQDNSQGAMYQFLDGQLSNWRDINRNPDFISWAKLQDPYSGAIRLELMRDAFAKADGQRLLNFFNGFLSDEAATDPAKTVQPNVPAPQSAKVPLNTFAAPGRAKAPAATPAPGDKETISRSQIANFYALVNKGHYRGNDAEKNRLEQMIFDAEAAGRVVDG